MTDALRARVQRLINGNWQNDDLTRLFLYARDRCDGRESVQEIGDFVAHHSERVKGVVTNQARDLFTQLRFLLPRAGQPQSEPTFPPNIADVLHASLRRMSDKQIRGAGVSRPRARELLTAALGRAATNGDGTVYFPPFSLSLDEESIVQYLLTRFAVTPAFAGNRLVSDLAATLMKRSLLHPRDARQFQSAAPFIKLFAAAEMHRSAIRLDDQSIAPLKVIIDADKIIVAATLPNVIPRKPATNGGIGIVIPVFDAELSAKDYCEPEFWNLHPQHRLATPAPTDQRDIEITPNRRLGFIK